MSHNLGNLAAQHSSLLGFLMLLAHDYRILSSNNPAAHMTEWRELETTPSPKDWTG